MFGLLCLHVSLGILSVRADNSVHVVVFIQNIPVFLLGETSLP